MSRPAAAHSLRHLDTKLVLLTAPTREQVRTRAEAVLRQECLSVVAESMPDLVGLLPDSRSDSGLVLR